MPDTNIVDTIPAQSKTAADFNNATLEEKILLVDEIFSQDQSQLENNHQLRKQEIDAIWLQKTNLSKIQIEEEYADKRKEASLFVDEHRKKLEEEFIKIYATEPSAN